MKKIVLLLLSINFLTINSIQVISCKTVEKNNIKSSKNHNKNNKDDEEQNSTDEKTSFIVDLNSNANIPITTSRGWKGTLNNPKDLEDLTKRQDVPYKSFTTKQKEFIKKFTTAMHSAASKKSIDKFNVFLKQKTFSTFDELVDTINLHNKNSSIDSYIDVPLELIKNHTKYPIEFEETLLKIYNTLCYFFGKNYGYKILRTLAITRKKSTEISSEIGQTSYDPQDLKHQSIYIKIDETVLTSDVNSLSYQDGWFTVPNMYGTFVHEFGHLIDFFQNSLYPFHEKIDNTSGLNNDLSATAIPHNEYKTEYCQNFSKEGESCPYQINPTYKEKDLLINSKNLAHKIEDKEDSIIEYKLDQNEALKKFIFKKVKNLKFPDDKGNEKNQFIQNMILKMFINSRYGRSLDVEIPSEGFTYWLLTADEQKDKTWEIWNEFFLEYLSKLRADTSDFNDYLKTKI